MKSAWYSTSLKQRRIRLGLLLALCAVAAPGSLRAGVPDWFREAARAPLPDYPEDTDAVLLSEQRMTSVSDSGEVKTVVRRVFKILSPQGGRDYDSVVVYFDNETRLTFLKAWAISAEGLEYESKEKEAIETAPFFGVLYEDTRAKILRFPAAAQGSIVGFEYEQKHRPHIFQDIWSFQQEVPVRMARFTLRLPKGWEFQAVWRNYAAREPRAASGNEWTWEVQDITGVESEASMPPWRAVAGRLAVTYFPRDERQQCKSHGSWADVGAWYLQLSSDRREASPAIKEKAAQLTADARTSEEKIRRIAAFVQQDVRYVAIEVGILGYRPHPAPAVFANRYGDCKDKVTLLGTMLREIGIQSYDLLVHSDRGSISPDFTSMLNFNHVILAIRLPDDVSNPAFFAVQEHPRFGRLLFFDPTDTDAALGYLPLSEQAAHGLLVAEGGGELLQLPLLPPSVNRLLRHGKFQFDSAGNLSGDVQEVRWGEPAHTMRAQLLEVPGAERIKVLESFLGHFLGGFRITSARVENLERPGDSLILYYSFATDNYAQTSSELLLFPPLALGQKSSDLLETKPRMYPVQFDGTTLQTDTYEFSLPAGYVVDELPSPTQLNSSFAEYRSKVEVQGNILRYARTYQVKEILVPTERLDELKKFYRSIAMDERSSAILKRATP